MSNSLTRQFAELRREYINQQFAHLNDTQKQAVFKTHGPLLILAGAGSGKTTVLVNRVANMVRFGNAYYDNCEGENITQADVEELESLVNWGGEPSKHLSMLLQKNPVRPYNVFAITFTNKAASELKERLANMLGAEYGSDVNASTFHSACVKILRKYAEKLEFPQSFTIYDSDDQLRTIKEVFKSLEIDDKFISHKSAIASMGRLKDKMISPSMAMESAADSSEGLIAKIYSAYAARLKSFGAFDFDDLIYYTVRLFEKHKDALEYYQNRYRYIMVDEYQDTSIAQFRLVELLASAHCNICVVGDDDQSIYRFRGATIENILNFENHFTGAKTIRLEQNYRSTSNILNAANCVIQNNRGRKGKTLWTNNGDGEKIVFYTAENEAGEASYVVKTIAKNIKDGAKLRHHAVLYRMNAQSGPIETYFARAGIPYKIVGGQRFYNRKEIKDMLSYMSIVANKKDSLRLKRIINEPSRKIGATTIEKLENIAQSENREMIDVAKDVANYPKLLKSKAALTGFYKIYEELCKAHDEMPLDAFVASILKTTGYDVMLEAEGKEGETRLENIGQLVSSVKIYADQRGPQATLQGFLEEVALISDIDGYDENTDVVVLMTMHAAKGLEFPHVFIVGMEESIFPSDMSRFRDEDLEEERRLCYVGITRAKETLNLSCASSRLLFGQTKRNFKSRFIDEIDGQIIEVKKDEFAMASQQSRYGNSNVTGGAQNGAYGANKMQNGFGGFNPKSLEASAPVKNKEKQTYNVNDTVEHKVFGRGVVLNVTPVAGDMIVEAKFEKVGVKKTMANYAPMAVIK